VQWRNTLFWVFTLHKNPEEWGPAWILLFTGNLSKLHQWDASLAIYCTETVINVRKGSNKPSSRNWILIWKYQYNWYNWNVYTPIPQQDSNPWFRCSNGKNKYMPYNMQPPWKAQLWTTLQHFIKLHCRSEYTLVHEWIRCIVSTGSTCNFVTKYFHRNQVTLPHIQISVTFSSPYFSRGKDALYSISTTSDFVKKNLIATCSS